MRDDDQGRAALVEAFQHTHDFAPGGPVEIAGGFVGEQQGGMHRHRAGDGDALQLAAGKLRRQMVGALAQTDVGEQLRHTLLALGRRHPGQQHRQGDVGGGIQARHQMKELEHEADLLAPHARRFGFVQAGDIAAIQAVAPAARAVEQTEQVEHG